MEKSGNIDINQGTVALLIKNEAPDLYHPHDKLNYYRALTCLPIQLIALLAWKLGAGYQILGLQLMSMLCLFLIVDINYVQHYHAHGSLVTSPRRGKILSFGLGISSGMDVHSWHLHHIYKAHHDLQSKKYPGKMNETEKIKRATLINSGGYVIKSLFPILLTPLMISILNFGKTYEFVNSRRQVEITSYSRAATHQLITYFFIASFIYAAPLVFGLFYAFTITSTILTNYITHKANGKYFKDGAIYLNPTYNSAQLLFGLHASHHRKNGHFSTQVKQLRHMLAQGQIEQAQIVTKWPECFLWSGLFSIPGLLSFFKLHPFQKNEEYQDFLRLRNEISLRFDVHEESFFDFIKYRFKNN